MPGEVCKSAVLPTLRRIVEIYMRLLLYDRITGLEPGDSITGVKTFSLSDEWLRGHFSKTALVPSVMYIEAMAQTPGMADYPCPRFPALRRDVPDRGGKSCTRPEAGFFRGNHGTAYIHFIQRFPGVGANCGGWPRYRIHESHHLCSLLKSRFGAAPEHVPVLRRLGWGRKWLTQRSEK